MAWAMPAFVRERARADITPGRRQSRHERGPARARSYEVTDILMQEVAREHEEECILKELKHNLDKFAKQWLTHWHNYADGVGDAAV